MRERIETIPVTDAFSSEDECPFCYLEREVEQRVIRYVLGPGASYMEPDVRLETDRTGFCRTHTKKLYDYGNTLGAALMLQTHYASLLENFRKETEGFAEPPKKSLFSRKKPTVEEPLWQRLEEQTRKCFICDRVDYHMERYYLTFFALLKDHEFRAKVESSKGFCLKHFAQLMEMADSMLSNAQHEWFYKTIPSLTHAGHLFCSVPAATKAEAVYRTCTEEITENCPATIMRRHDHAVMYVDPDSGRKI